jgi:hypothetical protein
MKILFAGPSLYGHIRDEQVDGDASIRCLPPAQQGDLARAVLQGASIIGLVDGRYEDVAAVWHKEILFAIAEGVTVLASASMGAMRAVECEEYGMIGLGQVFELYRSGEITDDGAVAQSHGPPELDNVPLTEALVNVTATLKHLSHANALPNEDIARLAASARRMFFKDRTYPSIVAAAGFAGEEGERILAVLEAGKVDIKRQDALLLVQHMRGLEPVRRASPANAWAPAQTRVWRTMMQGLGRSMRA